MNKLLSMLVAAVFALSASAFVAPDAGAQPKEEKKMQKEKGVKKSAPKKEGKATRKKTEGKKSEDKKS